jgi:hypothetical protein
VKRAFERRKGWIAERTGPNSTYGAPAAFVGERATPEERSQALADIASGKVFAANGLVGDHSPEVRDALLRALEGGHYVAGGYLQSFDKDPLVVEPLLKAFDRASWGEIAPLASAVGRVPGGREAMRRRIAEAARVDELFDVKERSSEAINLAHICEEALRFDPECIDAAHVLVRLFRHPDDQAVVRAIECAVLSFSLGLTQETGNVLRDGLWAERRDPESWRFFLALPALIRIDSTYTRYCEPHLQHPDAEVRRKTVHILERANCDVSRRALASAIAGESLVEIALDMCWGAHPLADVAIVVDVFRKALANEAPSIRLRAVRTLRRLLPDAERRRVAAEAAVDEPDEGLKKRLLEYADGTE